MNNFISQSPYVELEVIKQLTKLVKVTASNNHKLNDRLNFLRRRLNPKYEVRLGYMKKASRIGHSEYFPRKKETRIVIGRPSTHLCKQYYYIVVNDTKNDTL